MKVYAIYVVCEGTLRIFSTLYKDRKIVEENIRRWSLLEEEIETTYGIKTFETSYKIKEFEVWDS